MDDEKYNKQRIWGGNDDGDEDKIAAAAAAVEREREREGVDRIARAKRVLGF